MSYRLTAKHGSLQTPSIDGIKHIPLMFQVDFSPAAASSRSSGRAGPWRRRRPFAQKRDARLQLLVQRLARKRLARDRDPPAECKSAFAVMSDSRLCPIKLARCTT